MAPDRPILVSWLTKVVRKLQGEHIASICWCRIGSTQHAHIVFVRQSVAVLKSRARWQHTVQARPKARGCPPPSSKPSKRPDYGWKYRSMHLQVLENSPRHGYVASVLVVCNFIRVLVAHGLLHGQVREYENNREASTTPASSLAQPFYHWIAFQCGWRTPCPRRYASPDRDWSQVAGWSAT